MNNGLIGWIPERLSLQLIAVVVVFVLPVFCVLAFATLIPLMIWGEFWKQFAKDNNARGEKWKKSNILFIVLISCVALVMYIVWVMWLWSFSDADNTWLLDILYGNGNRN